MRIEDLHRENPYHNLSVIRQIDLDGWGFESHIFNDIIADIKPSLIVEVGTWKGASAIRMAQIAKNIKVDAQIVCVDTWLGSCEFWLDMADERRYKSLRCINGYPSVYYTFLNNVSISGVAENVIPFPTDSFSASQWFKRKKIFADIIYLDASHECDAVEKDIDCWWDVLRKGGVMFGDDYSARWPGVGEALLSAKKTKRDFENVQITDVKWKVRKS